LAPRLLYVQVMEDYQCSFHKWGEIGDLPPAGCFEAT
jgi:hypothetical protein